MWDSIIELKLLEMIREKDYMWNKKNPHFHQKRLKREGYQDIARSFGRPYTAATVRDRWAKIKAQYRIIVKNVKKDTNLTQSYSSSWHLWDALKFLAGPKTVSKIKMEDLSDDEPLGHYINGDPARLNRDDTCIQQQQKKDKIEMINSPREKCEEILREALPLIKLVRREIIDEKVECFEAVIANCMGKMSPGNADAAKQRIIDILAAYSQKNSA